MHADLILLNGHIETMDEHDTSAEAVAVAGGRYVAVGDRATVERLAGPRTIRVDLAGRTLLPGFIDTHMHLEKIVRELAMAHLEDARSHTDLLAALRDTAERTPQGEWIQSFGDDGAWHERQLAEQRLPDMRALDRVAPHHPVFLFRGPDTAALNSRAAQALATELQASPDQWDPARGIWRGPQVKPAQRSLPEPTGERSLQILAAGCRELLRMGITTVVDPGLPARFAQSWTLYTTARARGLLPQRVHLMNRFDYNRPFDQELARLHAGPVWPNDGDERLHAGAVKLLLDGEFTDAWMRPDQPAAAPGGLPPARRYSDTQLDHILDLCRSNGWPLCVHTMGGGAIDFVVDGVRRAKERGGDLSRSLSAGQVSLAHAFFPSSESLAECAKHGIYLSIHPLLAYVFEDEMQTAWGEFARQAMPLATMMSYGAQVAGGSDVLPCEPLRGAAMAVTRTCRHGLRLDPAEAMSPREALLLFTRYAGQHICRPDLGVVTPGAWADFAVWTANPLDLPPAQWPDMRAQLTAIAGEIVWEQGAE